MAKKSVKKVQKKTVKPSKNVGSVVAKKTVVVKDPRDKAYKKGPGFHKQTWFRPEGVTEPGLNFVGYEIADNDVDFNQFLHYDQLYTIRHGQNSRFFRNLLKGKLVGTKCPKCGAAWVPPRTNCWNLDCNLQETKWVEFPLKAKVHTWTVAGWSGRSSLKKLPFVLVYAKIEGSTVAIANYLTGIKPWEVEFGMPLQVVFVPERERVGAVTDFHFEPAKGWKPGPMTPEKERIKKLVAPIYEWVKTMK
ncbi:MAG: Zn-ribbon domain-containing OB-fold protein [Methanobacteriota archaeon]